MTVNKKQPNPIDIHVGGRIRLRRTMLGMSQEKLGEQLGITFQQVQKYEAGRSRLSAGRLRDVAIALGKPINYFYEPFPAAPEVRDLEHAKIGLLKREAKKLVDSLVRADDLETAIQILAALGPSRP